MLGLSSITTLLEEKISVRAYLVRILLPVYAIWHHRRYSSIFVSATFIISLQESQNIESSRTDITFGSKNLIHAQDIVFRGHTAKTH